MSETFTASNGTALTITDEGRVVIPAIITGLGEVTQQALRELFQSERDKEIGRWRFAENPDVVVYPRNENKVTVLCEKSGATYHWRRGDAVDLGSRSANGRAAAMAYFEAHPLPKPWHSAKPGEMWVLDWKVLTTTQQPALVGNDGKFILRDHALSKRDVELTDSRIADAKCVWRDGF